MVGVVVAIAIITILLAAVGPTISTIIERDREKELIFRGRQYARAILAFQKRYGRFPNELKELSKMKPRSIRKLWKDPMCNCDDWQVIIAGTPEAVADGSGAAPGRQRPGVRPDARGPDRRPPAFGFGDDLTPTPGFLGGGGGRVPVTPTPSSSSSFGPQTGQTVGPIVGVRTKVRRKTVFEWRGRELHRRVALPRRRRRQRKRRPGLRSEPPARPALHPAPERARRRAPWSSGASSTTASRSWSTAMADVRSFSLGFFVRAGSATEPAVAPGALALPRAPALQADAPAHERRDRARDRPARRRRGCLHDARSTPGSTAARSTRGSTRRSTCSATSCCRRRSTRRTSRSSGA